MKVKKSIVKTGSGNIIVNDTHRKNLYFTEFSTKIH